LGEQGWHSGESTRLPPMWPGFESWAQRHTWVEFVVGSCPCSERFFSGYSRFPLSSKTNISKFQFDLDTVDEEPLCVNASRFDTSHFNTHLSRFVTNMESIRYNPSCFDTTYSVRNYTDWVV